MISLIVSKERIIYVSFLSSEAGVELKKFHLLLL